MNSNDKKITVIIPNYNGIKYIEGCLDSLENEKKEEGTPKFGVIVVDNGSTDGSEVLLKEKYKDITKIFLEKNTGFCHAVNLGIKAADTPYVILLNNDTKVLAGFIKNLYECISRKKKTFAVSSQMLMWDKPELLDDAGDLYNAFGWAFARGKKRPAKEFDKRAKVFSACGGAAIYKRSVFEKIGYFDERHFAYLEDLDICYRAKIYGYNNYYEPGAKVLHFGSASTGSRYNEKKTAICAANSIYVIYKNMPFLQLLLNFPLILAGIFIKFIFFCKKKMGRLYLKGIMQGLEKSSGVEAKEHKIAYKSVNLPHYFQIQLELYLNILRMFLKIS